MVKLRILRRVNLAYRQAGSVRFIHPPTGEARPGGKLGMWGKVTFVELFLFWYTKGSYYLLSIFNFSLDIQGIQKNMQEEKGNIMWAFVVLALIVGAGAGYFFGNTKGRTDLLAEQKAAEEAAFKAAQEEIAQKANPFDPENTNPFKDGYKNPFEGAGANPFAN